MYVLPFKLCALSPSLSLGVVFVSITDSTDLVNDDLTDAAKEMGLLGHTPPPEGAMGTPAESDFELAQWLEHNEREAQLARDRELAEQLQMKEHTFRTPM